MCFSVFYFVVNSSRRHRRYARRNPIESYDILELELDCINLKMTLKNHRTNRQYQFDVDLDSIPLPWEIIFQLDHHSDRLRIF